MQYSRYTYVPVTRERERENSHDQQQASVVYWLQSEEVRIPLAPAISHRVQLLTSEKYKALVALKKVMKLQLNLEMHHETCTYYDVSIRTGSQK